MNQSVVQLSPTAGHEIKGYLTLLNAICIIIGTVSLGVLYRSFTSPLRHIPGPFAARFTDIWRLLLVFSGHAEKRQRQLHDKHGPAVRLGPNMVSISDPNMISQIYSRKNILLKGDFYAVNDLFVDGRRLPNVFSTRDEHHNTQVMKPIQKLFSMGSLLKMEPLLDRTISYFLQRLDQEFVSTGKACEMADWLHYCAWDIISEITFSQRMGFLEHGVDMYNLCKIGYQAMDYFSVVGMMPWLDLLLAKNPVKPIGPPALAPAVQFGLQRIAERRSRVDSSHDEQKTIHKTSSPSDFLDRFFEAQTNFPEIVTDDIVLTYVMVNVSAGSDTVAIELRSILYHLCRDKSKMARLQTELDQANISIPLQWADVQRLPYLCACVEEGMRIMPGVALPLERVVGPEGITLSDGKTFLPPGTKIGMNPWVVNRDATMFGEHPDQFRPERWLPDADHEDAITYQRRVSRMRNADLTFGAGKRQCAGRNLGLLECHKIIGSLVKMFDIELAVLGREWTTTGGWFIRQSGMDMRLTRRKLI